MTLKIFLTYKLNHIIDSLFDSDSEFSWLNLPQKIVRERKIGQIRISTNMIRIFFGTLIFWFKTSEPI